ncbi:MAG: L-threonylcarbamoyladenylate synthase [Acidiferrobacteraceae bacterium]
MAQYFRVHAVTPQKRLIRGAADIIRGGGVVAYPTDSNYALGCHLGDKAAVDRIRRLRGLDGHHPFTLVCRDLSELSVYARVDNPSYRLLKAHTPGPYTFVLPATREVPRRLQHPKRRTVGLRIPDHEVARALLAELNEPLLSVSLLLPDGHGGHVAANDPEEIRCHLEHDVDLVLDGGYCGGDQTTVIEFDEGGAHVVRLGQRSVPSFIRLQTA